MSKKTSNREIERLKRKIVPVLKQYGVKRAGVFGSYVRGEQRKRSDVDILIKPTKDMGFSFFGLQLDLEEKLRKKVDLVSYNGIHPALKDRILKEEIRVI